MITGSITRTACFASYLFLMLTKYGDAFGSPTANLHKQLPSSLSIHTAVGMQRNHESLPVVCKARAFDTDDNADDPRPSKWDPSPLSQQFPPPESTRQVISSLQLVTAVVSVLFVATIIFSQGRFVATASNSGYVIPSVVNPDELLQQDWQRSMTESLE